jgi:uncharacterized protein (UPF0276 family)
VSLPRAGLGLGWRRETAWLIETRPELAFTEVLVEALPADGRVPPALARLRARGLPVIPHGVSLSLGSGVSPDPERLRRLDAWARRLEAPFVSEHLAFVRGAGHETEHLLPVPRTEAALRVVIDNVRRAQDALSVPLVIENVAALCAWPEDALSEADFLRAVLDATDCGWLLDASNLYANAVNFGPSLEARLDALPLEHVRYVHTAGGHRCGDFYLDTHAHPLDAGPLDALEAVLRRTGPVPVLLERDDHFGDRAGLEAELDAVAARLAACGAGSAEEGAVRAAV